MQTMRPWIEAMAQLMTTILKTSGRRIRGRVEVLRERLILQTSAVILLVMVKLLRRFLSPRIMRKGTGIIQRRCEEDVLMFILSQTSLVKRKICRVLTMRRTKVRKKNQSILMPTLARRTKVMRKSLD